MSSQSNGGERVAEVLVRQGVRALFTLCGGHISPILVSAKHRGLRIVDVRDEATAVFAADATARLTGIPGVAAVTAGPGVTNTITAVKNAQLAQSPLILLGGATATVLRGRGALQDIDQLALFAPHVKWATTVSRVRNLVPVLERAFRVALKGVPGPVFVELPVDLLYSEETVRQFYGAKSSGDIKTLPDLAIQGYLRAHLAAVFAGTGSKVVSERVTVETEQPTARAVSRAFKLVSAAQRPVFLLGSQVTMNPHSVARTVENLERLGVPVFLSGMTRGLLGPQHSLWFRHQRAQALKEADLVVLAGVPCDFRLNYGRQIGARTKVVAVNRSRDDARKNRRPDVLIGADPAAFLDALASCATDKRLGPYTTWLATLRKRDEGREEQISQEAAAKSELVNPLAACRALDEVLDDDSVLVADGGDFVATASYITRPRRPLSWLDPGVFGTLGVGAGFALGAKVARPESEVWIVYGDGSVGYSLMEFDTFARLGVPVIAVVGNDAGWTQIARDQVVLLGDDVGTVLARTDYHRVAEALGGKGFLVTSADALVPTFRSAKAAAREGHPVLINIHLGKSEFRKGSISM
ncbi:MAG: thiamine pyrophosphate-binding protein [Myxococcota bacterium]|jgi:acetolactate synthase-1/2/3 large subunit|nr:thiamine pyrophosphate-binding protein [Myxococcota bacterium]